MSGPPPELDAAAAPDEAMAPAATRRGRARALLAVAALGGAVALGAAVAPAALAQEQAPGAPPASAAPPSADPEELDGPVSGGLPTVPPGPLQALAPQNRWGVADVLTTGIEPAWNARRGGYLSGGSLRLRLNAELLIVHSLAAIRGHQGASRQDQRIAPLVRHMTDTFFVTTPPRAPAGAKFVHAPGWVQADGAYAQDKSVDAVAARALAAAWRARDVVGLPQDLRDAMQLRMRQAVTAPLWRWPSHVLQQLNWSADVWEAHATITGDPVLLREDYRRALLWFAHHVKQPAYPGGSPVVNAGYGFRYAPTRPVTQGLNTVDSGEYASMSLGVLRFYDRAVAAGMVPLPPSERAILARWARRVQGGSWASSGYLNWDNGLGRRRLHLRQYWSLAARGLMGAMTGARGLQVDPAQVGQARTLFDRTTAVYQRFAGEEGNALLAPTSFGFQSPFVSDLQDPALVAARFAAGLAEAQDQGLDAQPAVPLPARFSSDSDIRRTAVTTERYATAFLRPSQILYTGGLEPARILDASGEPVTTLGGTTKGALGVRLRFKGTTLLDTQPGVGRSGDRLSPPRVPRAFRDRTGELPRRGLEVSGVGRNRKDRLAVEHRLRATGIATEYRLRPGGSGRTLEVRLPSWGAGVSLGRVGRTGAAAKVPPKINGGSIALRVREARGHGYVVRLGGLGRGTTVSLQTPAAKATNPRPGPQLVLRTPVPKKGMTVTRRIEVSSAPRRPRG